MTRSGPFAARQHRIGGGILRPLQAGEAGYLADRLARIDPWLRLRSSAVGLSLYFERRDPALKRWAIIRDGSPAGVLALRWPWLRGPFIEILAVLPEAQGAGLGRAASDWAAAQSEAVGANLWASVSDFNHPARRFWARMGFAEIAPLPDLAAAGFSEILLRRRLPPPTPTLPSRAGLSGESCK